MLERNGVNVAALRRRGLALPASCDSESTFSAARFLDVLVRVIDDTGDDLLALKMGQSLAFDSYGSFGFALMSCTTLGQALNLIIRYQPVLKPTPPWRLIPCSDGVLLRLKLTLGTQDQQQKLSELLFSSIHRACTLLLGQPLRGAVIELGYPAPKHARAYRQLLSVQTNFAASYSQFFLPGTLLELPVRTADPASHAVFHQQCEDLLRGLNRADNTSSKVRRMLIEKAGELPDIQWVASQLKVSERTLRRRLNKESSSFRSIVDEVKNVLACEYLTATDFTIAEIGHLLGYADTINFRRAFVRWNKLRPGSFRAQSRATGKVSL